MSRETSPFILGDLWLDKRRDGKSPLIWQIARYDGPSRSVIYSSTRKKELEDAKAVIRARYALEIAKGQQDPRHAKVIPLLFVYWEERGHKLANSDQTGRSLRTFIGFLLHDRAGLNATVTDMVPALFERFREWRMGEHTFSGVTWDDKVYDYNSPGVSGDTVDRNLAIRAEIDRRNRTGDW